MNTRKFQQSGNAIEKAQEQKPIQGWNKYILAFVWKNGHKI